MPFFIAWSCFVLVLSGCFYFDGLGHAVGSVVSMILPFVDPHWFQNIKVIQYAGDIHKVLLFFLVVNWCVAVPGLVPYQPAEEEKTAEKETAAGEE
ncbi:hypothetical protein [Salibacterium sp. K-3]